MPSGDSFSWIGPLSGAWNSASNWQDITGGANPATVPPGLADSATVTAPTGQAQTITGAGNVGAVSFNDTNVIQAQLNAGTLVAVGPFDIVSGGTVNAGTLVVQHPTIFGTVTMPGGWGASIVSVAGSGAKLVVNDALRSSGASSTAGDAVVAVNGGSIQVGAASVSSLFLSVDSLSVMRFGAGGTAAVGTIAIEPGTSLSLTSDYLIGNVAIAGSATVTGSDVTFTGNLALNAGADLTGGHLNFGARPISGPVTAPTTVIDGMLTGTGLVFYGASNLNGTGTIEVLNGGTLTQNATVAPSGLTFIGDSNSTVDIGGSIGAGNRIELVGTHHVLGLSASGFHADQRYYPEISLSAARFGTVDILWGSNIVAPPPVVDAVITGFAPGDLLEFDEAIITSATFVAGAPGNPGTLELFNGTTEVSSLKLEGDYTSHPFTVLSYAAGLAFNIDPVSFVYWNTPPFPRSPIPCFAAGTRIATPVGPVAVECLREGDTVLTISGQRQAIQWIGQRRVDCRRHPTPERVMPVRIAPHAFGDRRPASAVMLSPDHAVFMEGVMIPIKFLINDSTINQIEVDTVTYYHIELCRHDVVLAEGLPVETYLETGGRNAFDNGGGATQLHPDFAPDEARVGMVWQCFGYAPLLGRDGQLARVQAMLSCQAELLRQATAAPAPVPRRQATTR